MIPKIIHYCWFGKNPLPEEAEKYINTWKKYCPDYRIIEWNEDNFDVNQNRYCKEAYEAKKWAFVSDYARLKVLYEYGGVYMDTDVEMCKPLDDLLVYNACFGFESKETISTGVMAAVKNCKWIKELLLYYSNKSFVRGYNSYDLTTNVETITRKTKEKYNVMLNNTLQKFGDNYLLMPFDYLCAKDLIDGKIKKTDNTYTIHHFNGSWLSSYGKIKQEIKKILVKYFGSNFVKSLKKLKKKVQSWNII